MKRYNKPVDTTQDNPYAQVPLPTNQPCAIYARQSTARQVEINVESSAMQTDELKKKALALGWKEDQIILYIENIASDGTIRSASGTLRIDQRDGLSALMERVYRNEITAIIVYSESRLFRDETLIQVYTFVQACKEHDVRVITSTYQYDFLRRPYDKDQFHMQAKISADYITNHVKGLLHPARRRLSMRGLAVTGSVPVGFIISPDKNKDSDTYRKYIPYEHHAMVIRWIFKRYRELGGNLYRLGKEIAEMPFLFPDFVGVSIPPRFNLTHVQGGYLISKTTLSGILTNAAYIGYWTVNGTLISKNNHSAIVSEDDFFYAFNRLSATTIEGEDQEKKDTPRTRYTHVATIPVQALLVDVIEADNNKKVYVNAKTGTYRIYDTSKSVIQTLRSISISSLDKAFTDRLIWLLKKEEKKGVASQDTAMYSKLREVQASQVTQSSSIDNQLAQIASRMTLLRRNLNLEADEETLQVWARELKQLAKTKTDLEAKVKSVEQEKKEVFELATLLERVTNDWNSLTFAQQSRFIRMVVKRVILTEITPRLFEVSIEWKYPNSEMDTGYIFDARGGHYSWSEEEENSLREMYPTSPRNDILNTLSNRSWKGILGHANEHGIQRYTRKQGNIVIPDAMSITDVQVCKDAQIDLTDSFLKGTCQWVATSGIDKLESLSV